MIKKNLQWKILSRIKSMSAIIHSKTNQRLSLSLSRIHAKKMRTEIIRTNGSSILNLNLKKKIEDYCLQRFGSKKHWPWIALYTEMRGEYIDGWIPADYYRFYILKKYNPDSFNQVSTNKVFDHKLFSGFSLESILIRVFNVYYDGKGNQLTESDADRKLLNTDSEVVVKKDGGRSGEGITFIHTKELQLSDIYKNHNIVIQPVIQQCKELASIHLHSVNTLRVFTYMNSRGFVDLLVTVLRFGMGNSRCDSIDAGGGFCRINTNGSVGPEFYNSDGLKAGYRHPDSNIEFGKINIPNLDLAIRKCLEAHQSYPFVKFIGWDIAITKKNEPVLLEWNARYPGFAFFEALFGPLIKDQTF